MDAIIVIIIVYFVYKKVKESNPKALLYKMFNTQKFSNIKEIAYEGDSVFIRADGKGENFLFVVKNNPTGVNSNLINKIKATAQQFHIHNIIFVTSVLTDINIVRTLKTNNIKYWDIATLKSFSTPTLENDNSYINIAKQTILQTSDVSNDKCKIDASSYDPIQEGDYKTGSIFSGLFDKPERL